jgi:hypothetical protein
MHMLNVLILFNGDAWDKVPTLLQQSANMFNLCFGVVKLLITLNSSDWLRAHSMPNSIIMVHQPSTNVYHPLLYNGLGFLEQVWRNLFAMPIPRPFRLHLLWSIIQWTKGLNIPCRCPAQVNLVCSTTLLLCRLDHILHLS